MHRHARFLWNSSRVQPPAQEERKLVVRHLKQGFVNLWNMRFLDRFGARIGDDTNHRSPGSGCTEAAEFDSLAYGIVVGPPGSRKCVVDDRDLGRILVVLVSE